VRILVGTDNPDGCQPFDTSVWPNYNPHENSIVFVHRGACQFVEKVKHAEEAGIAAVVVIDHEGEGDNPVTMSPPEDFTHSTVTISAVAITHSFGQEIINAYNANQDNVMIASIEWRVPLSNGRVKLELFTSSNDAEDMDFKQNFREMARFLNQHDFLIFEPVYFIENGTNYGCTGSQICGDQCANVGRYCSVDPDHAIFFGISGYDIVRENLYQMCVYKFTQESTHAQQHERQEDIWWEYVANFAEECLEAPAENSNGDHNFHEDCSSRVMDKTDRVFGWPEGTMESFVNGCKSQSGDVNPTMDSDSTMLNDAIGRRAERDIQLLPSFAINGFETAGSWHCPEEPNVDNCNIFRALCSSFLEEEKPQVCGNDPGCPAGKYRDPCGECNANAPLHDTSPDCSAYTNEKDASTGSVIAIVVIVCIVTILLCGALYWLWQKNQEHEVVLAETKKYISLDDGDLQIGSTMARPGYGKVSNTGIQSSNQDSSIGLASNV